MDDDWRCHQGVSRQPVRVIAVLTAEQKPRSLKNASVNLRDLTILVADPGTYTRRVVYGMLRGFGANRILEAADAGDVLSALMQQKVDILILDAKLPPQDGLAVTLAIRRNPDSENRTLPILIMTSEAQQSTVKEARDAGANMVVAKPMSPTTLYDRLVWIAFDRRQFIDCPTYFGPDRRFKIEGYPTGVGRRASDKSIEVADATEPNLEQDDIDSLFQAARAGQNE
ncbi:response regulator [Pseudorhodoplanes sp.]|uniref:response regulator n=1 Tax=Pseudorhodoplanes sp. TaxID=1934341 RepID=UPI00391D6F07